MNNDSFTKLMKLVSKWVKWNRLFFQVNYNMDTKVASLDIMALTKDDEIVDLSGYNDVDYKFSELWDNIAYEYLDYGLSLPNYPDQIQFTMGKDYTLTKMYYGYRIFHENYDEYNESLYFKYKLTQQVPKNRNDKRELNRALLFHDERPV